MSKQILVTGACGYIGSHACVELLQAGFNVIAVDNFSNSSPEVLARISKITGKSFPFHQMDVRESAALESVLSSHAIDAAIHFAGLKAVGEAAVKPLLYFDNNVAGSISLLNALSAANVKKIIFSSSATVYGDPESVPITESARISPINPYGRTKLMIEQVLGDLEKADSAWRIGILRYFNPIGAHLSGLIGEDPLGIPNNLMPFVAQVAIGRFPKLAVFGNDYPTPDGTGVRDYIHVVDLARGHIAALNRLFSQDGAFTVNLGTGRGHSVLEVVRAFEVASGLAIPYEIVARRPGDIAACFASAVRARELLDWRAEKTLAEMCADHWHWQRNNPHGYSD